MKMSRSEISGVLAPVLSLPCLAQVQQLSKLWEAQNRQRDRELQLLRQHAESAMVEMRSSVGSAELAYSKATQPFVLGCRSSIL